jgi:hypothetical protein
MSPDLNPIVHIWDMLDSRIRLGNLLCKTFVVSWKLKVALHREWQQLSQHNIRRLTGGMRRRVDAVIQVREGYTRYWTLNNMCRQVINMWRFESEMTILSCFMNCEDQYLKWTCFTAKTVLVILWLKFIKLTFFLFLLWFFTANVMPYQVTIAVLRLSGQ